MFSSQSNREQASFAATTERREQGGQLPGEPTAEQREAESRLFVSIREPFWFMGLLASGATVASMWGLGALVLAIVGLSGVFAAQILPVTVIVLGLAMLGLGATAATWVRMFRFSKHQGSRRRIGVLVGVASAVIAGLVGVVLGILNLVFLGALQFGAVAIIVMGAGLLLHSEVMRRVSQFANHVIYHEAEARQPGGPFAMNALSLAPLRDFIVGLGAVILGILAVMSFAPVVLAFVALLTMGVALSASALTICGASLEALNGICLKSQSPAA